MDMEYYIHALCFYLPFVEIYFRPICEKDSSLQDGPSQHPFFNGVLKVIPLYKLV